jgi:hypothetical protein
MTQRIEQKLQEEGCKTLADLSATSSVSSSPPADWGNMACGLSAAMREWPSERPEDKEREFACEM